MHNSNLSTGQVVWIIAAVLSVFFYVEWGIVNEIHRDAQAEHEAVNERMNGMQRQIDRLIDKARKNGSLAQPLDR